MLQDDIGVRRCVPDRHSVSLPYDRHGSALTWLYRCRSEALIRIAARHYRANPTSPQGLNQQSQASHCSSSAKSSRRLSTSSETSRQDRSRQHPDLQETPCQLRTTNPESEQRDEDGSSRRQPDQQHHTRQSQQRELDSNAGETFRRQGHTPTISGGGINSSNQKNDGSEKVRSTATVIVADTLSLPHPDNFFDFAICIAVIHHLSTRERRVDAVREIVRKLRRRWRDGASSAERLARKNGRRGSRQIGEQSLSARKDGSEVGHAGPDEHAEGGKLNLRRDYGSQFENEIRHSAGNDEDDNRQTMGEADDSNSVQRSGEDGTECGRGIGRKPDESSGRALFFVWALEQSSSRRGWDAGDLQDQLVPWVLKSNLNDARDGKRKQSTKSKGKYNASKLKSADQTAVRSEAVLGLSKDGGTAVRSSGASSEVRTDDVGGENGQRNEKQSENGKDETFHRFYHLYAERELESECAEAGARVVEGGYERDNWWVLVEPDSGIGVE